MIGYICSAATDILVTFADDTDIVNLHNWSQGSFSGISWENTAVMCLVVLPASAAVFLLSSRWLRTRWERSMQKAWGFMWAVSGPGWCSYPVFYQLYRGLCRSGVLCGDRRAPSGEEPVWDLPASGADPACFLGGGVFCLFSDLLARTLLAPAEFSISTVTAVLGAPVVIAVMMKKYQRRG